MQEPLTVVIPSLNEPAESLSRTVDGIRESGAPVIVVDDHSDVPVAVKGARIIRNASRIGSAASRAVGIAAATTPFIATTDAHVAFRTPGWAAGIADSLSASPRRVLCFTCVPAGESTFKGRMYGGSLDVIASQGGLAGVLSPKWNTSCPTDKKVQCVMGGAYAFTVEWYRKIGGYSGMTGWCPTELASISLRSWAAGGDCAVETGIEVEHQFRNQAPFASDPVDSAYNKIRLGMAVLPIRVATVIPTALALVPGVSLAIERFSASFQSAFEDRERMETLARGDLKAALEKSGIDFRGLA